MYGLRLFFVFAIAGLFAQPVFANEYHLQFSYDLDCSRLSANGFPGLTGSYEIEGRKFRINLFKYKTTQAVGVTSVSELTSAAILVKWNENPGCTIKSIDQTLVDATAPADLTDIQRLAEKHSPVLVTRRDQGLLPERDVPLTLAYSLIPKENGNYALRYTLFFSNETVSGPLSTSKVKSLVQWGRRTDIEWIYEVEFTSLGTVVARRYQGSVIHGFGHDTKNFSGQFLEQSDHPYLFDIAKHNVFSDRGREYDAVQMVPESEISMLSAREEWMLANPWTFDVSDRELSRDGNLNQRSDEFLYILVKGGHHRGLRLTLIAGLARPARSDVKSLLNHLGGDAAFTALALSDSEFAAGGSLALTPDDPTTHFSNLKFFRLKVDPIDGFKVIEVTDRFHCDTNLVCSF